MSVTTLTSEKASFVRLNEAINSRDRETIAKTIDEVIAPDVLVNPPLPVEATGAEAFKEVFARLHRAFPDLHVAVEDVIAEGDRLACRTTVTGTHRGEYMGRPPTGRSITYNEMFIFRFAGGRIAETWGVVDVAALMRQLGVIPGDPGRT